ncbi:MAG: hypothetical protein RIT81_18145 [Deltaproteobacteria bacterium]
MKWIHTLALSGAIIIAGAVATRAATLFDDPFDVRIPYEGELWLDELPANGAYAFRFYVCNAPEPAPCSSVPGEHAWLEEHIGDSAVPVHAGKFEVLLGAHTSLEPVSGSPMLEIGVDVSTRPDPSNPSDWHALTGRQRIYGAPFAYRSVPTQSFRVDLAEVSLLEAQDADINVATIETLDALDVTMGDVAISGDMNITGQFTFARPSAGTRQRELSGGSWSTSTSCPSNSYVCGISVKTGWATFVGDHVRGVRAYCCYLGTP